MVWLSVHCDRSTGNFGTQEKNKGLVISYMVMCIISAVISWTVLIGFSWAEILMKKVDPRVPYKYQISFANDIRGWSVFLIFVAFTEGVIAVISSAICCHGVCCCSEPSSQGTVIYTVPNNAQNTGAYMVPGQQGFVYYPQQGPQVGGYNAQPMYVQGPLASNIAQQQHQQQQQQWPQQQPPQAQPMHAQSPTAYNIAQQQHQQQQQQWPQQQPPQAQQQPVDGATGQLAGPLPQKQ
ncbi:alpha-protein kinase 1 [Lingula anatina]|uniref:Alpha-protein kinase 1 n=1 Tax=Lingula anatina TaxID=7574 RepID=A0A1S3IWW8_LINAN|nr:alpha-protein kinase 1 [Lingula anatina]|eukprot:XP_013402543.1 alpha-protein kinase 1 [Lingula anatina]